MCKCKIQWIDSFGHPTPDDNEAIGMAVCYNPLSFGEKGSEPIPICEAHAKLRGKFWKLLPLPGQEATEYHALVCADERSFKIIPDVVYKSIKSSFPNDVEEILRELNWNRDHFYFNKWNMYIGVETDGMIHTLPHSILT